MKSDQLFDWHTLAKSWFFAVFPTFSGFPLAASLLSYTGAGLQIAVAGSRLPTTYTYICTTVFV